MVTVTINPTTAGEFRLVFDGGTKTFSHLGEERAKREGEAMARLGIENQLEVRPKAGSLWKLVGTFKPKKGGNFEFVDPYTSPVNPAAFDTDSFQGRIVS